MKVGRSESCTSVNPLCTGVWPCSSLELQTNGLLKLSPASASGFKAEDFFGEEDGYEYSEDEEIITADEEDEEADF